MRHFKSNSDIKRIDQPNSDDMHSLSSNINITILTQRVVTLVIAWN